MFSAQPQFDLRIPAGRPLVPLEAAMVLADRDEDDLLNLIQIGMLRWAFNLASPGEERREIRIFRGSLIDYLKGDTTAMAQKSGVETVEDVIAAILPKPSHVGGYDTIRGTELQRRFSCSQWLVGNQIAQAELALAPLITGPKVSPYILHRSAVEFLKRRELKGQL